MKLFWKLFLGALISSSVAQLNGGIEEYAAKWLVDVDQKYSRQCYKKSVASWNYGQNITSAELEAIADEEGKLFSQIYNEIQSDVLTKFPNWKLFKTKRLRRAFKLLSAWSSGNMSNIKQDRLKDLLANMSTAYNTATVCRFDKPSDCSLTLTDVEEKLSTSKNPIELEHYFNGWHYEISAKVKPETYQEIVDLLNDQAKSNGFRTYSEYWLNPYDDETRNWTVVKFKRMLIKLAREISALYEIIHAYVRMKLRKVPGYREQIEPCGYIPAHLTGSMWAQDMLPLDGITKPFPNAETADATDAMIKHGYTPQRMFQEADKFFKDLGLHGVNEKFWKNSVLEKPTDGRVINCHANAFDMCEGKGGTDYRITMCANVNQKDFVTAHHEMGHLEYFQQYQDLEFMFRWSANNGFHEAIGDSLALAVTTPKHLQCKLNLDLGFPETFCKNGSASAKVTESDLNYLHLVTLDKLIFLPFAFAVDFWRWSVFENRIRPEDYNKMWWKIRRDFQGVAPPTDRSSSTLFDPAAKYHVASNVDYIRYFISHVLQFQFYESMCIEAGEFNPNDPNSKPLFQCDFSGSKKAGQLIANMMRMGCAYGWTDAMEAMTGSREMSAISFRNYLRPLLDHMESELKINGEVIGFADNCSDLLKRNGNPKWNELLPPELSG